MRQTDKENPTAWQSDKDKSIRWTLEVHLSCFANPQILFYTTRESALKARNRIVSCERSGCECMDDKMTEISFQMEHLTLLRLSMEVTDDNP